MKKTFLAISALAAMLFAGCTSSDELTTLESIKTADNTPTPVQFGTYMGKNGTRATVGKTGGIGTAELQAGSSAGDGFGVFGYLTNSAYAGSTMPNFMYNQQVTANGGTTWSYSPVKYWPNGIDAANAANSPSNSATETGAQYLSFFAYAPHVATAGTLNTDDGIVGLPSNDVATRPVITFELPTKPVLKNSIDLLWGLRGQQTYIETDGGPNSAAVGSTYNTDLTKQTTQGKVDFLFKHALAKLEDIKVVYDIDGNVSGTTGAGADDANTLVTISSVDIKTEGASSICKRAAFDISQGSWNFTGATYYGDDAQLINADEVINGDILEVTPRYSSGWKKSDGSTNLPGITTTAKDLYSTYSPIMFIPKSSQVLEVTVSYVVRTYDNKLSNTANNDTDGSSNPVGTWSKVTQTITNHVTIDMLPNTKYTLVLHLGLTSVKFSAIVDDWATGTTSEVWLPSNVVSTTSTTLASGSTATVNTDASAHAYTINLTGLTNDGAFTATSSDVTNAAVSAGTTADGSGNGTATVTLTANGTGSPRSFTITITDTASSTSTTVTIVQAG